MKLEELFNAVQKRLQSADIFYGHAVECAEDEAILLMMHITDLDFLTLNQCVDLSVPKEHVTEALSLVEQRITTREPMAYVVGFSIFCNLRFITDARALVPRSPFGELIMQGFESFVNIKNVKRAMDMCTGSGCIGLSLAHYFDHIQVDLIDIDPQALQLAAENRAALALESNTTCIESDLFENIVHTYDLILANPPYVGDLEYEQLPDEYTHEPKIALISHNKGLFHPVSILLQAADYLNQDGLLFLEVGYSDSQLNDLFPEIDFKWLEFEHGGQGVCVFSREDLLHYRTLFKQRL